MNTAPRVSVIVPTLNRHDDIQIFIQSLCRQTHLPEEFIVVDAGEESELEAHILLWLKDTSIQLIYCRSVPGTSIQRNIAITHASGDILFFFDDDVILEPEYIAETLKCFDINHSPPVGGVLGTFTSPYRQPPHQRLLRKFFRMSHSVEGDKAAMMSSSDIQWLIKPSTVVPVPVCSGGRVAFRKECFNDEEWDDFLPGYTMAEDVEISCRIARKWTLLQTPYALLFHKSSPSGRNDYSDRIARRIFSRYYIFQKNIPKTTRNITGFLWWNCGMVFIYGGSGIMRRNKKRSLNGIKDGYTLCLKHILKQ